jgi:hypothetical protein
MPGTLGKKEAPGKTWTEKRTLVGCPGLKVFVLKPLSGR